MKTSVIVAAILAAFATSAFAGQPNPSTKAASSASTGSVVAGGTYNNGAAGGVAGGLAVNGSSANAVKYGNYVGTTAATGGVAAAGGISGKEGHGTVVTGFYAGQEGSASAGAKNVSTPHGN